MPVISFTVKKLESLKPPVDRAQIEYWDDSCRGFGLRITAQGGRVWGVQYRVRGSRKLQRVTLGKYESMPLADARIAARQYLDAASRGIDLKAQKEAERLESEKKADESTRTFGWLAQMYLNDPKVKSKRSYGEDERMLKREVLEFFDKPKDGWKNRQLNTISKNDVLDLMDRTLVRTQGKTMGGRKGKGIHANRLFALVRRVFNFAIENEHKTFLTVSPCHRLKRPIRKEESRDRVLSVDDLRALWKVLDAEEKIDRRYLKKGPNREQGSIHQRSTVAIFKLMAFTAQRGAEVRSIAWTDLDLENKLWTIPGSKTKNGKSHVVPLSEQAYEIVVQFLPNRERSAWVFPSRVNPAKHVANLQKAIERFRVSANIPYVGHDLRRTAASHMAVLGIPPHVIKALLNHVDSKDITNVYQRYSFTAEKRDALQKWADYLVEVVSKDATPKVVPLTRRDLTKVDESSRWTS